jgi:hypothetical protein
VTSGEDATADVAKCQKSVTNGQYSQPAPAGQFTCGATLMGAVLLADTVHGGRVAPPELVKSHTITVNKAKRRTDNLMGPSGGVERRQLVGRVGPAISYRRRLGVSGPKPGSASSR